MNMRIKNQYYRRRDEKMFLPLLSKKNIQSVNQHIMGQIKLKVKKQYCEVANKKGYVTRATRYSRISAREVVEYAAQNSGINRGQLMAAMYALEQSFENFLCNGHSVEFAELGTFRISVQAKLGDTAAEAGADAVRKRRIIYRPSVQLKRLVDDITLEVQSTEDDDEE